MFLLRALDTTAKGDLLDEFDSMTRGALSKILGTPVSDVQWEQAKLPSSMGGLGLRSAVDHAPSAYATSLISAQPLVKSILQHQDGEGEEESSLALEQSLLDAISARRGEPVTTESLVGVSQKSASYAVDLHNKSLLLNHFTQEGSARNIARLASVGLEHSGDWLAATPCPALGLHLRGPEFTAFLKYRLGIPLYGMDSTCPACGAPNDRMGDHALGCAKYGERIARHNLILDVLFEAAAGAALAPAREGRHLLPGTQARPADVLIPRWVYGKDAAVDITVTSPLSPSNLAAATSHPGGALTKAYERKVQGAAEGCRQQGLAFVPFALEALGGFHKVASRQIKMLGAALARQKGQEESETTRHLFQRVSLTLARGNSTLLVSRSPEDDLLAPEVDGRL